MVRLEERKRKIHSLTSRTDLFNTNASIVRDLAKAAADAAPEAKVLVISNPVREPVRLLLYKYTDQTCSVTGQLHCPNLR
jgi:malate/lactate dehydrogenase